MTSVWERTPPVGIVLNALRLTLGLVLAMAPSTARATVTDCTGIQDGTDCVGPCTVKGTCKSGLCVGGTAREDGTLCGTGGFCTTDDRCLNGVCVSGITRLCPPRPCGAGTCSDGSGCTYPTCEPDGGGSDMGDGGSVDMTAQPLTDMSTPDQLPAGDASTLGHIHGSGFACGIAPAGRGSTSAGALLALVPAALAWRRRRRRAVDLVGRGVD